MALGAITKKSTVHSQREERESKTLTLTSTQSFREREKKREEEEEEDVVDVAGGDSVSSRGGGAFGEADSEGPSERAHFQQGPPLSEPPRSQHDRHHYLHHR